MYVQFSGSGVHLSRVQPYRDCVPESAHVCKKLPESAHVCKKSCSPVNPSKVSIGQLRPNSASGQFPDRAKTSPRFLHFSSVSDLLYFINSDGCETLCVPNVKDGSGESMRYHLFLEMHDSLFYGHRGANATYAHMRSKF